MNWLVIASGSDNDKLNKAKDFLLSKNGEDPNVILISENLDLEELQKNFRTVQKTTHCIVIGASSVFSSSDCVFLMGFLMGSQANLLIYDKKDDHLFEKLRDGRTLGFNSFTDFDTLLKFIDEKFNDFEQIELERNSLINLFTMGIPFTADSFAHYLEKELQDVCQMFINAGMPVNAKTSEGVPMLNIATRAEHMDQVEWLIGLGADVNSISGDRGYTAVMDAVWRKNYALTEYYISKGAGLNVVSSDGQPILVLAVGNGDEKIVKLLLDNGADPDLPDSMGMSARKYAGLFKKAAIVEIMEKYPPKEK
ncbi:MAG: ankyrin repeat domain-containing protein [Treponema sp.]|nr:ankyrin repeat domain-containing protein [Treponema sp.]